MALSPNYSWAEPDNSSLVKNGAQDIRTLGDAIDTSVWNVGYGQAGKNKIINGDFAINQRSFTSNSSGYNFDRFQCAPSGATATASAQTFTLGTAPVAGYEGKNFLRWAVTVGNDGCRVAQHIESVRTFAGQTATVSFWAKGTNPTTVGNLKVGIQQFFGTGGSPSASVDSADQTLVLTANWTRYSFTFAIPSISGKTLGTANDDSLRVTIGQSTSISTDAWTLDIWGVQFEYGSKATPFQTASGGSIQGELAMCQRYYWRNTGGSVYSQYGFGAAYSASNWQCIIPLPVQLRVSPLSLETGNVKIADGANAAISATFTLITTQSSPNAVAIQGATSGATQYRTYWLQNDNNTAGYVGVSAEL